MDIRTKTTLVKLEYYLMQYFYINNIRQTQKEVGEEIIEHAEMKMLRQINKIKNLSKSEIEESRNNDPKRDLVLASVPDYT